MSMHEYKKKTGVVQHRHATGVISIPRPKAPPKPGSMPPNHQLELWRSEVISTGRLLHAPEAVPAWAVRWEADNIVHNSAADFGWPRWITLRHLMLDARSRSGMGEDLSLFRFGTFVRSSFDVLSTGSVTNEQRNKHGVMITRKTHVTFSIAKPITGISDGTS